MKELTERKVALMAAISYWLSEHGRKEGGSSNSAAIKRELIGILKPPNPLKACLPAISCSICAIFIDGGHFKTNRP
jgi:hypothetical protein